MKATYLNFAILVLIVGILSACGTQPTETPVSQPTEEAVPATETATAPPPATDTATPTAPEPPTEAPAATQPAAERATVSFADDVLPILQSRCVNCHGGQRIEEGLVLHTYADLMAGSDNGPVITPGNAVDSLLVELVATQEMPKRGPKLTPPQVQTITDWVNQGALDN